MKRMKKILALLLALTAVAMLFSGGVSAADIGEVGRFAGSFGLVVEDGDSHADEDGDDRHDDQQLRDREAAPICAHSWHLNLVPPVCPRKPVGAS